MTQLYFVLFSFNPTDMLHPDEFLIPICSVHRCCCSFFVLTMHKPYTHYQIPSSVVSKLHHTLSADVYYALLHLLTVESSCGTLTLVPN